MTTPRPPAAQSWIRTELVKDGGRGPDPTALVWLACALVLLALGLMT